MNLYFDTEFTGLHAGTTLVSIGIVAENGKKFYAESADYDESQCDDWIKENVLTRTILAGNDALAARLGADENTTVILGGKEDIRHELTEWLKQFDDVQIISDVCHYDMVLLIDIFGTAFDLPKNVSAVCYDINQDIARHYGIFQREAFDKSREGIVSELYGQQIEGEKHNALYDAEVIKAIYEKTSEKYSKIRIESNGYFAKVYLDGKKVRCTSLDFHGKVDNGLHITWDGIMQKTDEKGDPVIENDKVATEEFHYDNYKAVVD